MTSQPVQTASASNLEIARQSRSEETAMLPRLPRSAAVNAAATPKSSHERSEVLWLFGQDWAALAEKRFAKTHSIHSAGFNLFEFPSNAAILWFNMNRFVDRMARRYQGKLQAVISHEEQFGALAAALVAERLGLPGTNPDAILKLQHKEICRQIIDRVAPESNTRYEVMDCRLGDIPTSTTIDFPAFIKPIKASFSVLARQLSSFDELREHISFGRFERHIIDRLVTPFDEVCQQRLGQVTDARRMLIEEHVQADQFNLDGYVLNGTPHLLGVVDEIMYPDTQAFLRFEYPSKLPESIQQRAFSVASRVLAEAGFDHGFFNMEFFYDPTTEKLQIVEFNPRLAAQLADLYERVDGLDVHAMTVALAFGQDPANVPRKSPLGGVAASCALRTFDGSMPNKIGRRKRQQVKADYPDSIIVYFDKSASGRQREFKWLNSNRFGVINLHGLNWVDCQRRYQAICDSLGWPAAF
ncbi:MAG: ATP-grasp domain-containing protein [Burkholderiaceae bacterium]